MIKSLIKYYLRRRNMISYCRRVGMTVGERCIISPNTNIGTEPYLISIGNHCEITWGVCFITHDGAVWVFRDEYPDWDIMGKIVIEDNVYIGFRAMILPGVRIGKNSIVAAGAIVTQSIPPDSVVAGVPARIIKATSEYKEKCKQNAVFTKRYSRAEKKEKLPTLVPDPE